MFPPPHYLFSRVRLLKEVGNALDLMRDMDSENEPTSIIISSPSDAGLAPSQSSSMLVPSSVSAPTSRVHTQISGSHSNFAALHSSSHNKHQANQPSSPTKKFSVHGSNYHKALKTRAQSYSVLSASSSGGTSGSTGTSGTSGFSTSSGNSFGGSNSTSKSHNALASSPGLLLSPPLLINIPTLSLDRELSL